MANNKREGKVVDAITGTPINGAEVILPTGEHGITGADGRVTEWHKPNKAPLECKDCGHQWAEEIELPMEASAALARMRGWGVCPKCGSKKVYILIGDRAHE